jgi:hypothetical protein
MPGDLGSDCGRNDVTDVSDVSAMAQTTAGSPIHHHDERQSWDDHRSSVGSGPLEHARVQDRNFVRAFTSDYRVFQSPSTPDPGVTRPGALGSVGCVFRVARDAAKSEYRTIEET